MSIYTAKQRRERQRKWDLRFLELAKHVASWSQDPSTKVGAIVVDEFLTVKGMGYNGFPRGVKDTPDRYNDRDTKYKFVVHAEVNALINANSSVRGCTMYVWPTLMQPPACPECCKSIIQHGIQRMVCYDNPTTGRWQDMAAISQTMLSEAGIKISPITPEEVPS
jgi:dCMP deaminase